MVAVLPIVVNAFGDCPQALRERSYGRNRARKRARCRYSQSFPGNKFHWDILRAIVRFAGEIASWQFRRRLEFSDKMVRNSTTNARATVEWPSSLASRWQGGPTVSALNSGCQEKFFRGEGGLSELALWNSYIVSSQL